MAQRSSGILWLIHGILFGLIALTDLAVGGVTGATSVLAPFHFSTNYESSLARFLVGAARGALNGGSIGFFQGAATTAAQDSSWEQGIAMGFQTVMANGFQGALMGVAMGAPLEAFIAAVRPYELPSGVVEREGSTGRTRGANDEIGSDPRRNVLPGDEPPPGAASARETSANVSRAKLSEELFIAMAERLPSNAEDAAIAAVMRELGAGESISAEAIDQARRFMRGEPFVSISNPPWYERMLKWREHQNRVTAKLEADNPGKNIGSQVTLDVTNVATGEATTIVIDNLVPVGTEAQPRFQLVDAKFSEVCNLADPATSLTSTLTDNQRLAYGWIARGDTVTVVARGPRAALADIPIDRPITIQPNVQIHVNGLDGIVVRNYVAP